MFLMQQAAMEGEKKVINQALWLECAGPLITLPAIGSQVVYFPQGHSEQVIASTQKEADAEIRSYPNLPPQLFCLLHNITLHADQENDEVFAQMTLQPLQQTTLLKDPFLLPDLGIQPKQAIVSFSKTLTASDTSTHGGFSIPRRAAEKVFPPLDFTKTPPAQELVARDLHNNEWHFRHIYRGQPRRHLLTTGWSVFVSAKRLQAGDTVLFLRDEQGQHMLGIRRANRQQTNLPTSLLSSDSMLIGVLAAAAHAAATNSRFTIFYNPRASPSEFVIPLAKYQKALHPPQVTVGMRFRMEMETEDSSTRRYMGTITGIGDLDPVRWPNSHWRSLKVGWDESTAGQRQRRVSAWEIEPLTAPFLLCNSTFLLRSKRLRPNEEELDMKVPSVWPRGEEGKYNMQGINFGVLGMDHWLRLQQQQKPVAQSGYYSSILQEMKNVDTSKPYQPMPFNQMPPPGMLQPPQQLLSMPDASASYLPTPDVINRNLNNLNTGVLSRQTAENILVEDTVSSYTSMLTSQQTQLQKQLSSGLEQSTPGYGGPPEVNGGQLAVENTNAGVVSLAVDQENDPRSHVLFGVNIENPMIPYATPVFKGKEQQAYSGSQQQDIPLLNDDPWPQQMYPPPVRTFTKVHKVGSVGRSLDMTRFKNYNELRNELTRMFGLELDQKSGWQIVFIDNENDMLLLGDDPWEEFIGCVKSIRILSSSEISQMSQEHMEWLKSIPIQQKQASSSSEDPRQHQRTQQECEAVPLSTASMPFVPRSMNSYSDPSCISDGI